jgi:hypothetical protein
MSRWARVLEWHDYARELNASGSMPWAWGFRQMVSSTGPSAVDHGLLGVYSVSDLGELSRLLDEDPLRDMSDYFTVALAPVDEDFANDTDRFEKAKKNMIGESPIALLKYSEYEAVTAQAPFYVGKYAPHLPANPPCDFDRLSEPGDPIQLFVNGRNPGSYIGQWDDMRHLMHYQKVMWWHHYTWMLSSQGVKTHTWGTHDFCTSIFASEKSAAAMEVFEVPSMEKFNEVFALDPIRADSLYQIGLLRPIAEQRASDHRRAAAAVSRTGIRIASSTRRVAVPV